MTGICPHCGYSLAKDEPLHRDGFMLDPRGVVTFEGRTVPLRPSAHSIVFALAKCAPRPLSIDTLLVQMGSENAEANVVQVQLTWAKTAFRKALAPFPIENVWGRGYRWSLAQ
jgi:DNA-binding response OmpR family regulator